MRTLAEFAFLFLLTAVLLAQEQPQFRPSPKFTGDALPVPPQQHVPWTPPDTMLPEEWISTTETLFTQGLPDPRGCEYTAIEIGTGNCWSGDSGVISVHGWLLPGDGPQRFAVCWNGLVYPVVTITGKADLAADVRILAAATPQGQGALPEGYVLSQERLLPLKVCLLLRLGEVPAAETLWNKVKDQITDSSRGQKLQDPYLTLASDWAWAMFDRGVCAHMRGDDRLSVCDFLTLDTIGKTIEGEAAAKGFERPMVDGERVADAAYLQFLKQLPQFLSDEERRVKNPRAEPFNLTAVSAEKDRLKRIAMLIDGLDKVDERQNGQPGGVMLAWNRVIKALAAEGEAAVEPLIDCLEKDDRLTRSVSFGRDFFRGRNYVTVRGAAYAALTEILRTREFGQTVTNESAGQMAARLRAYWDKVKGVPLEERWYNTLADDHATPKQWMEAAGFIVQQTNIQGIPGAGYWTSTSLKPGETPPMRGEPLRGKTNPSVSELLARRIPQMAKMGGQEPFHMSDVTVTALNMAKWELPAALPILREMIAFCRATREYDGIMAAAIGRLTVACLRGNDAEAAADYAKWLLDSKPTGLSGNAGAALEPLWRNPDDQTLTSAADKLFNDPVSAWSNLLVSDSPLFSFSKLMNTPLLGVAGFRRHVLAKLDDRTTVGKLNYDSKSSAQIMMTYGTSYGFNIDKDHEAIVDQPMRVCDMYAWKLADAPGMPEFKPEWPEAERDRAIAAAIERLRQYGERYRFTEGMPEDFYGNFRDTEARMVFPRLEKPATEDDARQGRAIFALPADAQRRIVTLPNVPLEVKWVTWQQYPFQQQTYDGNTNKTEYTLAYHQEVTVWQAEEMLVDGKWQRFYGGVGPHELVRVPAEEIELIPGPAYDWGTLSNGFSCQAKIREGYQLALNAPATLDVRMYNRRGIGQRGPSIFNLPFDDGRPSLRPGMTLHLFYMPPALDGRGPSKWEELPSQAAEGAGWRVNEAWKKLEPGESYLAVSLDLAKCFDLLQPGTYRCYVEFKNANPAFDFAEGKSSEAHFTIGE